MAVLLAPLALAHHESSALETAYGNRMVSLVSRLRSSGVGPNPVAGNSQAIQAGREAYVGSCGQCHGAQADGKGVFGQTTFPPATDFTTRAAKDLSDQQMFEIIKDGLGFTPMPGYASQYSDMDIWNLVSFIRAVQNGQAKGLTSVEPTSEELRFANFLSADAAQRGAAVYFSQGCSACHGSLGQAPEQLNFDVNDPETARTIREGTKGMPHFGPSQISDAQLRDLLAYMATFPEPDE